MSEEQQVLEKVKQVAFRAGPKNFIVTTKQWKVPGEKDGHSNIEYFTHHLLVIPNDDEFDEGKELTNAERIVAMRLAIKKDRYHLCRETDLESEGSGIKDRDKKIASMSKELEKLTRENAILKGRPAEVKRA